MTRVKGFLFPIFLSVIGLGSSAFAQDAEQQVVKVEDVAQSLQNVAQEQLDTAKNLIQMITEFLVKYSFQVIGGIVVLVIGWMIAGFIANWIKKFLDSKNVDVTVTKFITGFIKVGVFSFAVIVAMGKFGIEIAPLIAGISVAGFGLSFALQGPLSNFAAGAVLIFTKPFKVGDIVEVAGEMGEIIDLKLARTDMRTVDGNLVVIPNKHIVGEIIHNFSDAKRVDVKVGVSYSADIGKSIKVVADVIAADERVIRKAKTGISDFGDSSVNIYARVWCKQDNYWDVLFDLNKKIFDAFKKEGIEIPFPQRDVHIIQEGK